MMILLLGEGNKMKEKTKNIILWILSITFLSGLFAMSLTWTAVFFILPALAFNPLVIEKVINKRCNTAKRRIIQACAFLLSFIVYAAGAPQAASNAIKANTASAPVSSVGTISQANSVTQSSGSKSSGAAASQAAIVPTVSNSAKLTVHYIDVGQGDSEFLELPNGQTMLIDAGIPEEGPTVVNYIKGLGHSKIDYLIATHPHADHIGGMTDVVNSFSIGKFYMPKKTTTTKVFTDLIAALKSKNLGINVAKDGVSILKTGNLDIEMLAPVNITGDDLNQYSAVVKVTYGANRFLFMGDAGGPSEEQITADVSADVLKVGHHGSNTASTQAFLNKVHPKYAVIEVGKGNSYGHPTAATLVNYKALERRYTAQTTTVQLFLRRMPKLLQLTKKHPALSSKRPRRQLQNLGSNAKITGSYNDHRK